MPIIIKETTDITSDVYQDALDIRKTVFVTEQQVPMALEMEDEDSCIHFVLYTNEQPMATVRLFPKPNGLYKIQRMAVHKEGRKKGFGRQIMEVAETYAKQHDGKETLLGAQTTALGFYKSMGYDAFGDEYLDAGIKHYDMKKTL